MTETMNKYIALAVAILVSLGLFIGATTLFAQTEQSRLAASFVSELQVTSQPIVDEPSQPKAQAQETAAAVEAPVAEATEVAEPQEAEA